MITLVELGVILSSTSLIFALSLFINMLTDKR